MENCVKSQEFLESFAEKNDILNHQILDKLIKKRLPFVFVETYLSQKSITGAAKDVKEEPKPEPKTNILLSEVVNIDLAALKKLNRIEEVETLRPYLRETLFVCVHGMNGTSNDLRNFASVINFYYPNARFFFSKANELKSDDAIKARGQKLAAELAAFFEEIDVRASNPKITFVCHSLGSLVLKSALPLLEEYKNSFESFMSLCSPHLGSQSDRFIIANGLPLYSAFKKSPILKELDRSDDEKTLLSLSTKEGLNWFKNNIFVGVIEDGLVSCESAKLMHARHETQDVFCEIRENSYKLMEETTVVRATVYIPFNRKSLENWLVGANKHVEIMFNTFVQHVLLNKIKGFLA